MSYRDNQTEKDYSDHGSYDYTEKEQKETQKTNESSSNKVSGSTSSRSSSSNNKSNNKSSRSIFSRMRDALTGGASNAANNAKKGFSLWKSEGGMSSGFKNVLSVLKKPRALAILASVFGVGSFSLFGLFSTYKNDGVVKNEQPLSCESGYVSFTPRAKVFKNVKQDTVDVMYDIFVKTYGYSEEFLTGMLTTMMTECDLNYSNIERDWTGGVDANENQRYMLFYNIAGGGDYEIIDTNPTTQEVLNAYYSYSDVLGLSWEPAKNNKLYVCDNGHKGAGIGLIGWTGNNGVDFITSVDKIYQDYDWYDLPYQCAYILAGFKNEVIKDENGNVIDKVDSTMQNGKWRTEIQDNKSNLFEYAGTDSNGKKIFKYTGETYNNIRQKDGVNLDAIPEDMLDAFAATEWYFERYANGGKSDTCQYNQIIDRFKNVAEVKQLVTNAKVNSKFSSDVTSMTDLIYMNTVNKEVYDNQNAQICTNDTVTDTVNVAMAAVSLSWLEKGDYADDNAAYGEYKRSATSPDLINDWDFVEMVNGKGKKTKEDHIVGKYTDGSLKGYDKYDVHECGCGSHDLIACTEFYYHAHLVAFPQETDKGFFSSCDRGTATAVRISGADDNFPAGNPPIQLAYVLGSNTESLFSTGPDDRSDQHNAQNQKLWKPTGFLRGCDWYSFEGKNTISEGNIMIAWDQLASNGFVRTALGGEGWVIADKEDEMNLRFVFTNSSTQTHIMTYTGGSTVRTYWGTDFLLQQFKLYDDADSLVRGDLTIKAPDIMQDAANFKAIYAKDAFDQNVTFYMSQYEHAEDGDKPIGDDGSTTQSLITRRKDTQFNQKTGLPEFRSWEQIFMRLTHDADDNNEQKSKYATDKDGYLDNYKDHITQYGEDETKANTYYFKDWNKVGINGTDAYGDKPGSPQSEGAYYADWLDYGMGQYGYTNWSNGYAFDNALWTNAYTKDAQGVYKTDYYWRYELAADIEYRTNQLERFAMAGFMCSYASENDANAYQNTQNAGDSNNSSGHILGNVYRRMSRIGEESDNSGRYHYYNTVVSNDMFQDLVQLYNVEGESEDKIEAGKNLGPYYDLTGIMSDAKSKVQSYGDRRYGLTYYDIQNILNGYARKDAVAGEQAGWGTNEGQIFKFGTGVAETGSFSNRMYLYMTNSLYDISRAIEGYGGSSATGNEPSHNQTVKQNVSYAINEDKKIIPQDLYGINPFLMVQEYVGEDANERFGVPVSGTTEKDKWLSFVDRHYYPDQYGNINMYAYSLVAMNPSVGFKTNSDAMYQQELQKLETSSGRKMNETVGSLGYVNYIYGSYSEQIAKRLFGKDDRNGDEIRDDYNRREYILIPYYHTHMAKCYHDPGILGPECLKYYHGGDSCQANGNGLHCLYSIHDIPVGYGADCFRLDGIRDANAGGETGICDDVLDTFSFDLSKEGFPKQVDVCDKFEVENLQKMISAFSVTSKSYNIRYFTVDGSTFREVKLLEEKPDGHVECGGCIFTNVHHDEQVHCEGVFTIGHRHTTWCETHQTDDYCHPCTCSPDNCTDERKCPWPDCDNMLKCNESCTRHACSEFIARNLKHGVCCHMECDSGGHNLYTEHGEPDKCHDLYGCNILEYLYHEGKPVYMLVRAVDNPSIPIEEVDINDWVIDGKLKPDEGNIVQLMRYDNNGYVWQEQVANGKKIDATCMEAATGLSGEYKNSNMSWNAHGPGDCGCKQGKEKIYDEPKNYELYNPGLEDDFVGLFTIEGDIITQDFGKRNKDSEPIVYEANYHTLDDLSLIESIRNRVGNGKYGEADGHPIMQTQDFVTGIENVKYYNESQDNGTTPNGYGEALITGASHGASPVVNGSNSMDVSGITYTNIYGGYGDPNVNGGSGPDTAYGNKSLQFGNSLIRYLLGDEHVYHIRFGSQEKDVVTGASDPGLGYDFEYFYEYVDVDPDAVYIDHETGKLTLSEYSNGAEQFRNDDGTYDSKADAFKNEPLKNNYDGDGPLSLGKMFGKDADGKNVATELLDRYKNQGIKGQDDGLNGDYGLWLTHASRGDRGMKTEYIVLKDWFGDPYDGSYTTANMQYMMFEHVMQYDENDVDKDDNVAEGYIYGHSVFGSTNNKAWYGQGSNSHWRNLINLYNESLATRQ